MKKIEAIVRTTQFEVVRDALANMGVQFFTIKDVRGYGLQKGEHLKYRGSNLDKDYIPRVQLDIVTTDEKANEVIKTIEIAGKTGEVGDGKIFQFDVEAVVRIRTGERDQDAI